VDTWDWLKAKQIVVSNKKIAREDEMKLFAYGSSQPLVVKGSFFCDISCGKATINDRIIVCESGKLNILGREASIKLGILKIGLQINSVSEEMPKLKGKINRKEL
jgi:hypothetical protein